MLLKRILDKFGDSAKHVKYRMEKFEQSVRELLRIYHLIIALWPRQAGLEKTLSLADDQELTLLSLLIGV